MKQIFIKQQELEEYLKTSKKDNRVRKFWKEILKEMPKEIYNEVKTKSTKLIKQEDGEFEIIGAIAYQFEPEYQSKKLFDYLNTFAVFVETNSDEIHRWKKRMHNVYGLGI